MAGETVTVSGHDISLDSVVLEWSYGRTRVMADVRGRLGPDFANEDPILEPEHVEQELLDRYRGERGPKLGAEGTELAEIIDETCRREVSVIGVWRCLNAEVLVWRADKNLKYVFMAVYDFE